MTLPQKVSLVRSSLAAARSSHALLRLNQSDLEAHTAPEIRACVELLGTSLEAAVNAVSLLAELVVSEEMQLLADDMYHKSKLKGVGKNA